MKKDYTEIMLIVDNSGSMTSIKTDAEGGLAEVIKSQRALPGKCNVSLINFSDTAKLEYESQDIHDISKVYIRPTNSTALNDAVGLGIEVLGRRLAAMPENERPEHVIFCIVTDGFENSSKEFTTPQIKEKIEHQQNKYSWQFLYVGAGKEAFDVAKTYAISAQNTMAYTADKFGTQAFGSGISCAMKSIRTRQAYNLASHSNV